MAILYSTQIMIVDAQSSLPTAASTGQFAYCIDTMIMFTWNGTTWMPSSKVTVKKSSASVNLKSTGTTLLYTLESTTLNFYPIMIVPRATGVGISTVVLGPTFTIGTNSTSYNNIATSSLLSSIITALTGGSSLSTNSYSPALAGGTAIYSNVSIGASATNYTVLFDIIGFYDA